MIRATLTSVILLAAVALGLAPAASAARPVVPGYPIYSAAGVCTIGFPDPVYMGIVYTASHCYDGKNTEVWSNHQRIGRFRPDLVYNKELDLIAVRLYDSVPSRNMLCGSLGCQPIKAFWAPKVGDYVCKYGANTRETCGPVTEVWDDDFAMDVPGEHGDSGGPIYLQEPDGLRLVGLFTSRNRKDHSVTYGTPINRISTWLLVTWGAGWNNTPRY